MSARARPGTTRTGCLLFVLVTAGLVYFGLPAAEAYWRFLQFRNALQEEVRFHAYLPDARVRARLQAIADSLGLPEDAGAVTITRRDGLLLLHASYEEAWRLPGYDRPIHFDARAAGRY